MSEGEGSANRTWRLPTGVEKKYRTFCLSDLYHEKEEDVASTGFQHGLEQLDFYRYGSTEANARAKILENGCATQKSDTESAGRLDESDTGHRKGPCPGVQNVGLATAAVCSAGRRPSLHFFTPPALPTGVRRNTSSSGCEPPACPPSGSSSPE